MQVAKDIYWPIAALALKEAYERSKHIPLLITDIPLESGDHEVLNYDERPMGTWFELRNITTRNVTHVCTYNRSHLVDIYCYEVL